MANLGQKIIAKSAKDNALFLFATAAIGWFLASAAQVSGIALNTKIDKNDKKFLIPQEIGDGAANIGLYALVTTPLIWLSEKLVDNGTVSFKNIEKNTPKFEQLKGGIKVLASFVGAVVSCNIITPIIRNKLASMAQRKSIKQKVSIVEPNYDPCYQPFFRKNFDKTQLNMKNYITFTRGNGLKI